MFFTLARGCDSPATEMGKAETNTYAVQCDEDNGHISEPLTTTAACPAMLHVMSSGPTHIDQAHPTAPQASAAQRRQCPGERTQGGNVTGPERRDAVEHLHDQRMNTVTWLDVTSSKGISSTLCPPGDAATTAARGTVAPGPARRL